MSTLWKGLTGTLRRVTGRKPAPATNHAPVPAPRPGRAVRSRQLVYAPQLDGDADPGEIVWTWVAYEDDRGRGKDRRCWWSVAKAASCWG